ncbi:alpha/beta fold hydrolase [Paraburkholderia sediminicola]|uniref:alpha/beta fold hydrolase n=1 Tax=Paraburkholderia sediminicola TaxID=458836 RepID=UPI0038BD145C
MNVVEQSVVSTLSDSSLPEPRDIDVGGVRTRYYDIGTGPETIAFVYGGNFGSSESASSAYAWNLNVRPLAARHRVIAFDKLGQGYTEAPRRDEDYTMAAVVDHICQLLDTLKPGPVHLVGHSRGGFASARVTLERPDLVRSLTIVSSGTLSPGVGTNEVVLAAPPYPPFSRESARWVYENYCYQASTVTDEWLDQVMDVLQQPSYLAGVRKMTTDQLGVRVFLPALARMKRETLRWIDEGRLQRPVQLVWGANDRTVVMDRGIELFNMIAAHERRVTLNVFNESGHFPYREHPARFNALLDQFVNQYKARG